MAYAKYNFPPQFLWGSATSSHQVEGNNLNNNWSQWESISGKILKDHKSGMACDWWGGRWREDFQRAADTGQNTHRLSIEWSRIQPEPDVWDENALEVYREMIRGIITLGMKPMVTLHHFTDPIWFIEQGGWKNKASPIWFKSYVEKVHQALKPLVTDWITIDEPNLYVLGGFITGLFPPGSKKDLQAARQVTINMIHAHSAAYHAIHNHQPEAAVAVAINMHDLVPATRSVLNRGLSRLLFYLYNQSFLNVLSTGHFHCGPLSIHNKKAKNTQDFIGVNFFTGSQVHFTKQLENILSFPAGAMLSDNEQIANEPESFESMLDLAAAYQKPIYVTANGAENAEDSFRREYIADHIHQLWRAWSRGVPVKGYYHWSLIDNFAWEHGWTQKFGLWQLEQDTQKRIRRESVDFYEAICRKNALDSEDVEKFAPGAFRRLFV